MMQNEALKRLIDTIMESTPHATCADVLELVYHLVVTHALPRAKRPEEVWPMPPGLASFGPLADAVRQRRDELDAATTQTAA